MSLLMVLAACSPMSDQPTLIEFGSGSDFGGLAPPDDARWVRNHLSWLDGSEPDVTLHALVIFRGPDPCVLIDEPALPLTSGDPELDCEAERQYYRSLASAAPSDGDNVSFEFALWDTTTTDSGHTGVAPQRGTFTSLDGPDGDRIEFAFTGVQYLYDWNELVADSLDCTATNPWDGIPQQDDAQTVLDGVGGAIVLHEPDQDAVRFSLDDVEVVRNWGAPNEGGTVSGSGTFAACDLATQIEPSPVD